MNEKEKLETMVAAYIEKIEAARHLYEEGDQEEYKEASFENFALAKGSIKYAELTGVITREEASVLKEKLTAAAKGLQVTDFIF